MKRFSTFGGRCAVALAIGVACGCQLPSPEAASEQPQIVKPTHTQISLGAISLDEGPRDIEHVFDVRNEGTVPLEVIEIHRSCSCTKADLSGMRIEPGAASQLHVSFTVSTVGGISYATNLVFNDGSVRSFVISGRGEYSRSLMLTAPVTCLDSETRVIQLRLVVVDSKGGGVHELPVLTAPDGAKLVDAKWSTIEVGDSRTGRPWRQIANMTVDFSEYVGAFPAQCEVVLTSGEKATIRVFD